MIGIESLINDSGHKNTQSLDAIIKIHNSASNSVERLNMHLSLLVERFVPTKVIRVRNKDKPWFIDDCRHAFDIKQGLSPVDS